MKVGFVNIFGKPNAGKSTLLNALIGEKMAIVSPKVQTTSLLITGSGASDIKGYGLVTDYCEARASGASDIQVTVNKEIKANASGASSIHYKGGAVMTDIHTSGASSVARKDD